MSRFEFLRLRYIDNNCRLMIDQLYCFPDADVLNSMQQLGYGASHQHRQHNDKRGKQVPIFDHKIGVFHRRYLSYVLEQYGV